MTLQLIAAILCTAVALLMLLRWQKLRSGGEAADARSNSRGVLLAFGLFAVAAAINWLVYLRAA